MTDSGQVRRFVARPPTIRFALDCRHHAALPRADGLGHKRSLVSPLIERQSRSILILAHTRQIIAGIDVSCPAEEELLECLGGTCTQRVNYSAKGDLHKKLFCSRDRYQLEVIWEYPCPIGN